jgi:hypothetical protein
MYPLPLALGLADRYRHARVHFLVNRGLNARRFDEGCEPELALSYDAMCILKPNLINCFTLNHPDTLHRLLNAKFLIPALHVRNHKELCKYVYTHAYTPGVRRFFGETAEYFWPCLNCFGGQIRQMTNGHRQDTIIRVCADWNWRKIQRLGKSSVAKCRMNNNMDSIARQLEKELTDAKQQYVEKRDTLRERCMQFDGELSEWMKLSREPIVEGKRVTSVYKHDDSASEFSLLQPFMTCWC